MVFLVFFCVAHFQSAVAHKISQISGSQIVIKLSNKKITLGSIFALKDSKGKIVGGAKVMSIKNGSAVAVLSKGSKVTSRSTVHLQQLGPRAAPRPSVRAKAAPPSLVPKQSLPAQSAPSQNSIAQNSPGTQIATRRPFTVQPIRSAFGIMVGNNLNSMQIKIPNSSTDILSGTSSTLQLLYDRMLFGGLDLRALVGLNSFTATGSNLCFSATNSNPRCFFDVQYGSFDLWAKYHVMNGLQQPLRSWVGLGMAVQMPLSKASNAINVEGLGLSQTFSLGGGFDFRVGRRTYLPIQMELSLLPPAENVTASLAAVRLGVAFPL